MTQVISEGADLCRTRILDDKQIGSEENKRNPPPNMTRRDSFVGRTYVFADAERHEDRHDQDHVDHRHGQWMSARERPRGDTEVIGKTEELATPCHHGRDGIPLSKVLKYMRHPSGRGKRI